MKIKDLHTKLISIKGKNISQGDFGLALGCTRQYAHQLFKKETELSDDKVVKILNYFSVDKSQLGDESAHPELSNFESIRTLISDEELEKLEKIIKEDKELLFLFYRAWQGDKVAVKMIKTFMDSIN